jgi:hypothetical protein
MQRRISTMPARHRITIRADERRGLYSTLGAAAISSSPNPMRSAAVALLEAGADRASTLEGRFEGALVGPATLASIVKPRHSPRSDISVTAHNAN